MAADQPSSPQPLENRKAAIKETQAIAGEAIDFHDLAMVVAAVTDRSALREDVQHALLVL